MEKWLWQGDLSSFRNPAIKERHELGRGTFAIIAS